jgi:predicted transcriptional regulator of viral defense system
MATRRPDWNHLYALAEPQEGHFTLDQAGEAGYSAQLLTKYLKSGRVVRATRGVYRLVHFPVGDHEDLVTVWLWSRRLGVFSHETALMLHELSDTLPAVNHLTLPEAWRTRRLRTPQPLALHYSQIDADQRTWNGSVPVTTALRTVNDCAQASVAPDIVLAACTEGLLRGLFRREEIGVAAAYLHTFGQVP